VAAVLIVCTAGGGGYDAAAASSAVGVHGELQAKHQLECFVTVDVSLFLFLFVQKSRVCAPVPVLLHKPLPGSVHAVVLRTMCAYVYESIYCVGTGWHEPSCKACVLACAPFQNNFAILQQITPCSPVHVSGQVQGVITCLWSMYVLLPVVCL
jgi:hypothetical protein